MRRSRFARRSLELLALVLATGIVLGCGSSDTVKKAEQGVDNREPVVKAADDLMQKGKRPR